MANFEEILKRFDKYPQKNNRDEDYVISLCDEALGLKASRQHRFDFLKGDAGTKLPVDAYYEEKRLVVEYYERQHTEPVKFFDRKNTVSGVTRDMQRRIYDKRRKEILPQHGITLIIISYDDFKHNDRKRIIRDKDSDLKIVKQKLKDFLYESNK